MRRSKRPRAPTGTSSASGTGSESASVGAWGRGVRRKSLHLARALTPLLHRVIALKPPRGHGRAIRLARAQRGPALWALFRLRLVRRAQLHVATFRTRTRAVHAAPASVTDVQSRPPASTELITSS